MALRPVRNDTLRNVGRGLARQDLRGHREYNPQCYAFNRAKEKSCLTLAVRNSQFHASLQLVKKFEASRDKKCNDAGRMSSNPAHSIHIGTQESQIGTALKLHSILWLPST